jgi:hypothetical protein
LIPTFIFYFDNISYKGFERRMDDGEVNTWCGSVVTLGSCSKGVGNFAWIELTQPQLANAPLMMPKRRDAIARTVKNLL